MKRTPVPPVGPCGAAPRKGSARTPAAARSAAAAATCPPACASTAARCSSAQRSSVRSSCCQCGAALHRTAKHSTARYGTEQQPYYGPQLLQQSLEQHQNQDPLPFPLQHSRADRPVLWPSLQLMSTGNNQGHILKACPRDSVTRCVRPGDDPVGMHRGCGYHITKAGSGVVHQLLHAITTRNAGPCRTNAQLAVRSLAFGSKVARSSKAIRRRKRSSRHGDAATRRFVQLLRQMTCTASSTSVERLSVQ